MERRGLAALNWLTARIRKLGLAVVIVAAGIVALISAYRPDATATAALPALAAGLAAEWAAHFSRGPCSWRGG